MTTEPSARVTVNEKPVPGVNTDELTSEANTKKTPPSATAKLTVPVPALSSAPSRMLVVSLEEDHRVPAG